MSYNEYCSKYENQLLLGLASTINLGIGSLFLHLVEGTCAQSFCQNNIYVLGSFFLRQVAKRWFVEPRAKHPWNPSTHWLLYPLMVLVGYVLPSFIVNSRTLILVSGLACWTIVFSATDPEWLFKVVLWVMIRRIRRCSSDSFLNEMTVYLRRGYMACFCKREVVGVEILGKMHPPSCSASCNSEGTAWKNKVTKQKDHDIVFGDNKGGTSVNWSNKSSSVN